MLSIQLAGAADVALIRKLALQIWPAAYSNILSADQIEYMLQLIYSEEALAKQMAEGQQFYIAYMSNEPAGFLAIGPNNTNTYKLHKLYVLHTLQGNGVGKQLLQFVINTVQELHANFLILNVNRQNPALHFYKKMGFEITSEVNIDIGKGYFMNDYIMQLSL